VAFKITSLKPTKVLLSLQAYWHVLVEAQPKQNSYQGTINLRRPQLIIEIKACVKVHRLPPSPFT
jgi:hypothetical protein